MKTIFNVLIIVAAAAIGLAAGFALRPQPAAVPPPESGVEHPFSENAADAKPDSLLRRAVVAVHDDSPLATQLEIDLSMSDGVTRWLHWLDALERAAPADFPRLAHMAEGNPAVVRLLAARWAELDPRHMFESVLSAMKSGHPLSFDFQSVLFDEWVKHDPEAVIAALNEPEAFKVFQSRRSMVAGRLIERDVERGLRLFSEWNIENYGPRMTAVPKWAAANPRHAAEFALAHPAGFASRMVMEEIGKEWAKTDPGGALQFAVNHPGELGSILANSALKQWAERDLHTAADWLGTVDGPARNRLYPAFVEAWGKQDSAGALAWCEQYLSGSSLAQAVGGIFRSVAATDSMAAAELVTAMQPSPARAEAAAAVAEHLLPEFSSNKPIAPGTLAWLAGLDLESVKRVVDQTGWRWAEADPKGMMTFLAELAASSQGAEIPERVYSYLGRSLARTNPSEALEWASRLPEDRALTTGSNAFTEWRRSQPDAAMKWLSELPPADARRAPFFRKTIERLVHEPHAAGQLAGLTPSDRAAARTMIEKMPLAEDRRAWLLHAIEMGVK